MDLGNEALLYFNRTAKRARENGPILERWPAKITVGQWVQYFYRRWNSSETSSAEKLELRTGACIDTTPRGMDAPRAGQRPE